MKKKIFNWHNIITCGRMVRDTAYNEVLTNRFLDARTFRAVRDSEPPIFSSNLYCYYFCSVFFHCSTVVAYFHVNKPAESFYFFTITFFIIIIFLFVFFLYSPRSFFIGEPGKTLKFNELVCILRGHVIERIACGLKGIYRVRG